MNSTRFVLAVSLWDRMHGLLGARPRWNTNTVLVLAPCKSIHTWWMRYPIDIAFVDERGEVLYAERDVAPWRIVSKFGAHFVLERPSCADPSWFKAGETLPLALYGRI